MKKLIKPILWVIGIVVFGIAVMLVFLTLSDYNPDPVEKLKVYSNSTISAKGDSFSILTYNIGYGALGASEDFFLDDGVMVRPKNKDVVYNFLEGITNTLKQYKTDFIMVQEIDTNSKRSHYINQLDYLAGNLDGMGYSYGKNYDVKFIPMPFPPMGKVVAGLSTFSSFKIESVERHSFEGNYKWPLNTIMLDRCFTITRIPLKNKTGDLILINTHFSAYDDGSLRLKQLGFIKNVIQDLYKQGNYVVLGGDWNQTFESIDHSNFPLYKNGDFYIPSVIPNSWIDPNWTLAFPKSIPTYRLLNSPYKKGETQVGIIDGFLTSPNIKITYVDAIDLNFKDSDHNPVLMEFTLDSN